MIHRSHRFHGHGSLRFVYRRGQTVRSPLCLLKFVSNPKRRGYRAAVVVSTKISKKAVTRNRIRRRMYEQIRLQAPAAASVDFVFTALSDQLAGLPAPELAALVSDLLRRAARSASR